MSSHHWFRLLPTCWVFTLCVVRNKSASCSTDQSWVFFGSGMGSTGANMLSKNINKLLTPTRHKLRVEAPPGSVYRHKCQRRSVRDYQNRSFPLFLRGLLFCFSFYPFIYIFSLPLTLPQVIKTKFWINALRFSFESFITHRHSYISLLLFRSRFLASP
jgi:hypothetical protein